MRWIAASEKDTNTSALEKKLWEAADMFGANAGLKAQEYSGPILGLIFLRFAKARFAELRKQIAVAGADERRSIRVDDPVAYNAQRMLYLTTEARFDFLLKPLEVRLERKAQCS